MSVSNIVTGRLNEMAHNFLGEANNAAEEFTRIMGTVHPNQLNGLLGDCFKTINNGKWTPEMVDIMKECVKSESYSKVLKNYVNVSLKHTVS